MTYCARNARFATAPRHCIPGTVHHGGVPGVALGIKVLEVPYNGAGPATTALLGGEVEILPVTVAWIAGLVKAGQLKALAVTQKSRVPMLPDVPTMPELGYPDIVMGQWNGVFGPAALPQRVIAELHKAITSAMRQEQVIQRLNTAAAEAVFSRSPQEVTLLTFAAKTSAGGRSFATRGSPPSRCR